ncbi:hypothetical protein AAG570_006676 [Ranatra chinensis]|uniref:Uncharacterized protein n=1 Tax=Ranatra chinensis TaxID=642074 RepID=A0ABD0YUP7_9HEMI
MLKANYFKLLTHTDWALYQYRVDFSPEEERTSVRKALLRVHKEILRGFIFDGTLLFTAHRLSPDPLTLYSCRDSDNEKITITIKKVSDLAMGDAHYIQFFNILMRKCLGHLSMQLVGRNFFDARAKIEIPNYKLELWPGYITSIRQHESSILMCAEITHKVMRQDTVLELLVECSRRSPSDWKNVFQQSIIGSIVLTGYNNNTYRIDDVDFDQRPTSTFELKTKEKITYIDYFWKKYQIQVKDVTQPLLVSRAKARNIRAGMTENIILIPELCSLTGITDEMRANFSLMKALADYTRVSPADRIKKLNDFSQRLQSNKAIQDDLTLWNMKLSPTLIEFPARVMRTEKIVHGEKVKSEIGPDADWTKNMRNRSMLVQANLHTWVVVHQARSKTDVLGFINTLIKSAASLNFKMPQPVFYEIRDDRIGSYIEALDRIMSRQQPQIIMCIVPNNRADRYSAIKKKCCIDRAVATQVVVERCLRSKGTMSIATKIAIQMNCKIGGAPWTVDIPISGVMVIGFDVCHDTSMKGRSFGAMVASLDQGLSRYYSTVSHHSNGEELSNDISINITKALMKYRKFNNTLPSRIFIYRDGVGEGQIPFVFEREVEMIKDKLTEIYQVLPRMAFVVVTKRLNTRLFLNDNNPPPGTIVDDYITCPDRYDFFLVSQSVRQGTVSPTCYNVMHDTSGLSPARMQRFTYKMTHLYYNWSGTVRVPAQCQYAHKLAFLVGQSLHRQPNPSLEDYLYFL